MIVGVCGHRPARLGDSDPSSLLRRFLRGELSRALVKLGASLVWSGGALGADEDACHAALELGLPFCLALPFPGYTARWSTRQRRRYQLLRQQAREWLYVSDRTPGDRQQAAALYRARNLFLVRQVDHLVAVWDGGEGGTAQTVRLARSLRRGVTVIDPRREGRSHANPTA
ncbi:MAG: SLOG family protein [Polyangia bacterium]